MLICMTGRALLLLPRPVALLQVRSQHLRDLGGSGRKSLQDALDRVAWSALQDERGGVFTC